MVEKKTGDYNRIVSFYENCFATHGDCAKGMDWPNAPDLVRRYDVMLDVIKNDAKEVRLLDFGCGTAMLYEHLMKRKDSVKIIYSGLDLSPTFIKCCREKFPDLDFLQVDILKNPEKLECYDYIVMNGVFTEKISLTFGDMLEYFKKMLRILFTKCNKGLAFNVMSKQVEWEKDVLFHLPLDTLADFLTQELTRNFVIRNDYGLYEYTTYVYK
ncbi:MAG: class I SAM-dependent methyltransferase [Nitrospinales bacterium]